MKLRYKIKNAIIRSLGLGNYINTNFSSLPSQPINVNSTDTAMKLSAAYRCTAILSGTIASLPLQYKRKKNGVFVPDEKETLYRLLTRRPNNRMSSFEFIRNMVILMVNRGNAYIFIRRTFGEPTALILLSPGSTTYDKYTDTYTVCDIINHINGVFESNDIIHLRHNSQDGGYTGVSVIESASRVMSVAASADNQTLKTFQNGGKIKGIISGTKGESKGLNALSDNQTSDVAERVESELSSGRDIVSVSGDMSFSQLSFTPADTQLIENKKLTVLDICRFYGVHPDKVFAGQPTNYKASEMGQVSYLTDTLQPYLRQIESEFETKLIYDAVAFDYKIGFDLSVLYQTDLMTQVTYWKTLLEIGGITSNEIRSHLGKAPISGGDIMFITCNVAPADSPKIRGEAGTRTEDELPKTEDKNIL